MSQSETWTGPSGTVYELVETPGIEHARLLAASIAPTVSSRIAYRGGDAKEIILRRKETP